jgi:hypothetical protein
MPTGTCDPASRGNTFNTTIMAVANGKVEIIIRWGWDGVSVLPDCEGPLVNGTGGGNVWAVQVTNNDTASWWVHTVGKRGQPRNVEFTPGSVTKFTKTQASNNGYDSYSDFSSLVLDQDPNPPAQNMS